MNRRATHRGKAGFTLVELMVVIAIIALLTAIALPNLWPIIAFSEHEGSARTLAHYGRAVGNHAVLTRETITVHIDIDGGKYWCTRMPEPEPEEDAEFKTENLHERPSDLPVDEQEMFRLAQSELAGTSDNRNQQRRDEIVEGQAGNLSSRMQDRSRRSIQSRAALVDHEMESNMGQLYEDQLEQYDDLHQKTEEELEPEEVKDSLIPRIKLPQGIYFQEILVNEESHVEGEFELTVTPLGLASEVTFYVANDRGDVFTVVWDPITGGATMTNEDS